MKRVLLIITLALTATAFMGCSYKEQIKNKNEIQVCKYSAPFKLICSGYDYDLVYDIETGVEYTVSAGYKNNGTFTMLMDAHGYPKIYSKYKSNEK